MKYYAFLLLSVLLSCAPDNKFDIDVQGHRGCRGLMPENTIPGFLKALDLGVQTLEMDVVISQDKKVVVSHEPFFHHHISTGPDNLVINEENEKTHNLYYLDYSNIEQYDVGLKFHPGYPQQEKVAVVKPLLSEVIEASENHIRKKRRDLPYYNIEIKRNKALDYYFHPPVEEFVDLVLREINNYDISDRVIIQSFDNESLQITRKNAPDMPLALLIENRRSAQENIDDLGFTPEIYSCYYKFIDEDLVNFCKSQSIKLVPWTVNEISDIQRMVFLGVDGIISDYPDRVFSVLKSL